MSEAVNEPLQRWHVGAIVGTILLTLTSAAFIYAMRADIDKKANAADVAAIRNEVRDVRSLLCDAPENSGKQACRRTPADYREHSE